jgi:hypothetical protein
LPFKSKDVGIEAKEIFLIDSHVHKDFELNKLQMSLVRDVPDILKKSLIKLLKRCQQMLLKQK